MGTLVENDPSEVTSAMAMGDRATTVATRHANRNLPIIANLWHCRLFVQFPNTQNDLQKEECICHLQGHFDKSLNWSALTWPTKKEMDGFYTDLTLMQVNSWGRGCRVGRGASKYTG
jgi:hypothetical protein